MSPQLADPIIRAQLAGIGLRWINCVSWNDDAATLMDEAIERGEGERTRNGSFAARTGVHTGRSPKDKFIVRDETTTDTVWWDNAAALSPQQFEALKKDFMAHARLKSLFVQDLLAGANPLHEMPVRIITEKAWHALFMNHLLIHPTTNESHKPQLTIINLPGFKADPARHGTRSETVIAMDIAQGLVLIGGTDYAGEMKKAVFTVLNYWLPESNALPMHCSANIGHSGDTAIFFGLSGTGKTTLSADPERTLIGDDEHGWSADGVFNFEGGCYAKAINLSPEAEPAIHAAATAPLSVLENVVLQDGAPDFTNTSLTENTRSAYPLSSISHASATGLGGIPKTIIMLTADAFGVMPPIAKLTPAQAMYHFISGYTAKVAGTERGIKEPQATFSACFGAPFLPRHPAEYGKMLKHLMAHHKVQCYIVNTGWTGGAFGEGTRIPLRITRALVTAALDGTLNDSETRIDPNFGFEVPTSAPGVPATLLNPRETWNDKRAYDQAADKLVGLFMENFAKFEQMLPDETRAAGPVMRVAAE